MFLPDATPFGLAPGEKRAWLVARLKELTLHHRDRCAPYARIVESWTKRRGAEPDAPEDFPFIPVTIFKEYELRSTGDTVMRVRSSATTTGTSSTIFVDKPTRQRQSLSANRILADFVGADKRPYLVFDLERTVRGADALGARGAAILSLAHLATEFHFVLREDGDDLVLDDEALARAVDRIGDGPFIAYGFTHILYRVHERLLAGGVARRAHPSSVLLHSGGWKRLAALAVDKPAFGRVVSGPWGLPPDRVIDFYGAVEQVGVPYPDCPMGVKHVPYWADVVTRRRDTLEPASIGEAGLLQLMSCLPLASPNHSVLTEDLGEVLAEDGCPCGRRGKAFVFRGRAPRAEARGCSDVWRA